MTAASEDEVEKEINVYLSKSLSQNLYLLQYPTRPAYLLYDDVEYLSARIKPKQQKVELEIAINTHNENYDRTKGERIAHDIDAKHPTEDPHFESSAMDKQVLSSRKAVASTENYAIGYLQKNNLHITPLHSVVQMRPSFNYMDKLSAPNKQEQKGNSDDDEAEPTAITVRFENYNSERAKKNKERSYEYLQQQSASEPWTNISYNGYGSNRSVVEKQMLICSQMDRDATSSSVTLPEYLKELLPDDLRSSGFKGGDNDLKECVFLPHLVLVDQIKHLMINATVLRFSEIVSYLPSDVDPTSVENLVHQFAVLVQGCWVVKSDLVYEKDSQSPFTGLSAEILVKARDYVVWQFTRSRHVTRNEILSVINIPDEDLKQMISEIAFEKDRTWEFKYEYDEDFAESHPATVQRHEMWWETKYRRLVKELRLGLADVEGASRKPALLATSHQRQRKHTYSSHSEDGEESGTDASTSKEVKMPKRSYTPKRRSSSGNSKQGKTVVKPFQMATLSVSPTVLEMPLTEETKTQMRNCVSEALRAHFCISLDDFKEILAETQSGSIIYRTDFEKLLEQAVAYCGGMKLKNKWPEKATQKPLYAFTKFGNKLDRYRNVLMDLFSTTARLRDGSFTKQVEDELKEIISNADRRQILEDYCIHKSGFFYLKGTVEPEP